MFNTSSIFKKKQAYIAINLLYFKSLSKKSANKIKYLIPL